MSKRFQRGIIIILSLIFFLMATILILFNINSNIVFFLTPSEILEKKITYVDKIRIGGIVKINSYQTNKNNIENLFVIKDNISEIKVYYEGVLPNLFKEGSGVVAEGKIQDNILYAKRVFAKHDENYMPSSIADELKKSGYWNNQY